VIWFHFACFVCAWKDLEISNGEALEILKVASSPGCLMDGLDGSNAILQQEQQQQSLNPKDWIAVGSLFWL